MPANPNCVLLVVQPPLDCVDKIFVLFGNVMPPRVKALKVQKSVVWRGGNQASYLLHGAESFLRS